MADEIADYQLRCPWCHGATDIASITGVSQYHTVCSACGKKFRTRIVRVRTSNSRSAGKGQGPYPKRSYTVRVYNFDGSEDVVEFDTEISGILEFKSGDVVGFSFAIGVDVVQNFTLGRNVLLTQPFATRPLPTKRHGCCGCLPLAMLLLAGVTTAIAFASL